MKTNDFIALLKGVKKTPQGWAAQCPAHEDKRSSLSIKEGEKGIVCKCHAGCGVKDIAAAVGLKLADLFSESKNSRAPAPPVNRVTAGKKVSLRSKRNKGGILLVKRTLR
jgi:hypothetical protein